MARRGGPVGPELLVEVDRQGDRPLHEQLERALREDIRSGRLRAGTRLPSTRGLAGELGVSRGVVSEAYGQLAAEGYLAIRQGAPVRVAATVRAPVLHGPGPSLVQTYGYHFHPGLPDLAGFPREAWLRSVRTALRTAPLNAIGYGDPRGALVLRETLAGYLARVRGTASDAEQMVVCAGFAAGFSLLCRVLHGQGVDRIAQEDPGWHTHRLIAEQAGLEIVPIPVDRDGIRIDALRDSDVPAVVVTPAHQFPTGAVLARDRRTALLEWAEQGDRLIIEDDYDSELRYAGAAVGALQGLAPERVVHLGSTSKRLAPGIRLGWMLLPSWLTWPVISAKAAEDGGSEIIGQLALADFTARGELERHLRRMRQRYRARREVLLRALARSVPRVGVSDSGAGLYELVELPSELDESALLAAAAKRDLGLEGLSLHRFAASGPPALVLGFANLSEPAIEHGVQLLAQAFGDVA
jgi:GntR family transcriptional regulator/MocR family aminotransferase